jgi:hypothetical protein
MLKTENKLFGIRVLKSLGVLIAVLGFCGIAGEVDHQTISSTNVLANYTANTVVIYVLYAVIFGLGAAIVHLFSKIEKKYKEKYQIGS